MMSGGNLPARLLAEHLATMLEAGDKVRVTLRTGRVVDLGADGAPLPRTLLAGESVTFTVTEEVDLND